MMQQNIYDKSFVQDTEYKMMTISEGEFELIRTLIYDRFGINLSERKRGFVASRLNKLLRAEGFKTFKQYYDSIVADSTGRALVKLANFISTNYTFFNREKIHFDFFLNSALPLITDELKRRNKSDIRVWSAGCSTGEEAYMLMMMMAEHFAGEYRLWDAGVLATDISEHVLNIAKRGIYNADQVALLPDTLKHKYFTRIEKTQWVVKDEIKKEVVFRQFNLMNRTFPFKKPFHVIFCRNVMIYFDKETRDDLVRRFYQFTEPGGFLFIGHSESLPRGECPYKYIMPALYRRED